MSNDCCGVVEIPGVPDSPGEIIVGELARRELGSHEDGDSVLSKITSIDLLAQLEQILYQQKLDPAFNIRLSHGTTAACTKCGRLEAPAYYLKRSHGHYALLCYDGGKGCWEHSPRANCTYVDQHSSQCMELAEWAVAYGDDKLKERHVCNLHVPAVLGDATVHHIYHLQD